MIKKCLGNFAKTFTLKNLSLFPIMKAPVGIRQKDDI